MVLFFVVFLLDVGFIGYMLFLGIFLMILIGKLEEVNFGGLLLILFIWIIILIEEGVGEVWICRVIGFEFKVFWLICEVVVIILVWGFKENCDGFFLNVYDILGVVVICLMKVFGDNFFWIWKLYCVVEMGKIVVYKYRSVYGNVLCCNWIFFFLVRVFLIIVFKFSWFCENFRCYNSERWMIVLNLRVIIVVKFRVIIGKLL